MTIPTFHQFPKPAPVAFPYTVIGIPSADMVYKDFAMHLAGMVYGFPGMIGLVNAKSSIITNVRNQILDAAQELRKQAQSTNRPIPEWVLWLDSDMTFPADTLTRLLSHKKDIVGATYPRRVPPFGIIGRTLSGSKDVPRSGLVEFSHMPFGVLLTRMSIFDKMKKPYFRLTVDEATGQTGGEDFYFCDSVRSLGYSLWCDMDLTHQVTHLGQFAFGPGMEQPGSQEGLKVVTTPVPQMAQA
jgi:hypothetical protein